jgi:hypothetical protein
VNPGAGPIFGKAETSRARLVAVAGSIAVTANIRRATAVQFFIAGLRRLGLSFQLFLELVDEAPASTLGDFKDR